jgi:signal transduction histidine kinase
MVLGLALAILGMAVVAGYRHLQRVVRQNWVSRDGEILYAVALAQQYRQPATNLTERLRSPAEQLSLALEISQLREGVLGVRIFNLAGDSIAAFPANVMDSRLDAATCATLMKLQPVSRFYSHANLGEFFIMAPPPADAPSNIVPLLEVDIPVHARGETQLLACAQLLLDARDLASRIAAFDNRLKREAMAVFCGAGVLLAGVLLLGYARLQKANRLLHERTEHLLRANHELTLAAKTGAIGAVTAHLIHGLSNPLANLLDFIDARKGSHPEDSDWQDAAAAARRMQELVHDVVRVLGEQGDSDSYELSLQELVNILQAKVRAAAHDLGVRWEVTLSAHGQLSNHHANIVLLILENLILNALEVTPKGRCVQTSIRASEPGILFQVADEDPGFPAPVLERLFTPCRSTKGGAGLGLAISKQLAVHLEARLELQKNGPEGCVMGLTLPWAVFGTTAAGSSIRTTSF